MLFAVRKWRVAKIVEVYRLDDARVRRRHAKYAGMPLVVAEHAEGILRDRCVQEMEEIARHRTRRGRGPQPKLRSLKETRAMLRSTAREVLARDRRQRDRSGDDESVGA